MGPSQVVTSFPRTVWDGTTASRLSTLTDAPPSKEDWNRLVSEVIALQQEYRDAVGLRVDNGILVTEPAIYGSTTQNYPFQLARGIPAFAVIHVGQLAGDEQLQFFIEESDVSTGGFIEIKNVSTGNSIGSWITTFTPTKKYQRFRMIRTGEDQQPSYFLFVGNGTVPTIGLNLMPAVEYAITVSDFVGEYFQVTPYKMHTLLVAVGDITADSGGVIDITQSDGPMGLPDSAPQNTIEMATYPVGGFVLKPFMPTKAYVRIGFSTESDDIDTFLGATLLR